MEQIVRIFGVNRANCDTSTKVGRVYVTFIELLNIFCQIGKSKIQDGGHFPRWRRTNAFDFIKLEIIAEIVNLCVKINVSNMMKSPLNVP